MKEGKKKLIRDLKTVATREKRFATLAAQEGKGAMARAKAEKALGRKESAKDSRREARLDKDWSTYRKSLSKAALAEIATKTPRGRTARRDSDSVQQ